MSKITIEEVKSRVESQGFTLISSSYKNLDSDLEIQCHNGHSFFKPFKSFRVRELVCPYCNEIKTPSLKSISIVKTKEFRILALDQATLNSGWSLWDGQKIIAHGVVKVPEQKSTGERIYYLKQWLISMIENNQPDLVIMEDIQLQDLSVGNYNQTGVTTFKVLAKLQGVLENTLIEKEVPCKFVYCATWRKKVGVKGKKRADKKRSAQQIVKNTYGLSVNDDEADAICIGQYGVQVFSKQTSMINWE